MKKTLGGERLGAGKRMKVDLHGYSRSTHNLGYLWRSTMSAGTLIPFMKILALPGDTFDIDLDCDIKTHPTVGPLFGSYKIQLDLFQAPIRLYQGQLHNNKLGIGMNMASVKLPHFLLRADPVAIPTDNPDNAQINPSCVLSYLGIRGVGKVDVTEPAPVSREFNGVPLLALWDIYKNYYSNKQEEIGAVIHAGLEALVETVTLFEIGAETIPTYDVGDPYIIIDGSTGNIVVITYTGTSPILSQLILVTNLGNLVVADILNNAEDVPGGPYWTGTLNVTLPLYVYGWKYISNDDLPVAAPKVVTFPLENIDTMREKILAFTENANSFSINTAALEPYSLLLNWIDDQSPYINTQEGLPVKTYQSDLFNNWLSTEWIDGTNGINEITSIDTSGGSFSIDTLNLSKKVYEMLNRIALSGGTYNDWLEVQYDHEVFGQAETPIYHGGLIKELVFQEVISNSESNGDSGGQPLGTLGGRGIMSGKKKGGRATIRVNEPSYLIGIISATPRIDYSQGNDWDIHLKTMNDLHVPALDEIGFQDLIEERMAWWTTEKDLVTGEWIQKSAGKQPAWIEYMTSVNRTYGNFAIPNNEMFMTLNRRYEMEADGIKDLTTYIDPVKFNYSFAQTSIDAQNFWAQIAVDITARRKMSARVMPNV